MIRRTDREHYRARLDAERSAITNAACEEARTAHRELAEFYEKLLNGEDEAAAPQPSPMRDPRPSRRA